MGHSSADILDVQQFTALKVGKGFKQVPLGKQKRSLLQKKAIALIGQNAIA